MSARAGFGTISKIATGNGWPGEKDDAPAPTTDARFVTIADAMALPPRQYLIKGVFGVQQLVIIVAPPWAGKTTLTVCLVHAIARGEAVFGRRVTKARVIYAAAEDPHGVQMRFNAQSNSDFEPTSDLLIMVSAADVLNGGSPAFAALLAKVKEFGAGVVVFDTLHASLDDYDENDGRAVGKMLAACRQIMAAGATVILLHHPGKHDAQGRPRGHGGLLGAADVVLSLEPTQEDRKLVVASLTKAKDSSGDARLAFRIEGRTIGVDIDGDPVTAAVAVPIDNADIPKTTSGKPQTITEKVWSVLRPLAQRPEGVKSTAAIAVCLASGISDAGTEEGRGRVIRRSIGHLVDNGKMTRSSEPGSDDQTLRLPAAAADDSFDDVGGEP